MPYSRVMQSMDFEQALTSRVDDMLDACTKCGACFEACPITAPAGLGEADPKAVVTGVLDILRLGKGPAESEKWAKACVASGECIKACDYGVNPRFLLTMNFGSVSGVAINSRGHIFLLHRGPNPLMEFDADGKFVRALGEGLFDRPHGLRIDPEDNIWTTDVAGHVVCKLSPAGRILMVLGVRGRPGEWHDYGHLRLFNEPNDLAFAKNGDVIVLQGHEPKPRGRGAGPCNPTLSFRGNPARGARDRE